jgi:hypothetical protein
MKKKRKKLTQPNLPLSSLSSLIPSCFLPYDRGVQGDYFPGIFWYYNVPLIACGTSYRPLRISTFFLEISQILGSISAAARRARTFFSM